MGILVLSQKENSTEFNQESFIPCALDCIHQKNGYCGCVDTTSKVECADGKCAYYKCSDKKTPQM